MEIGDPVFVLPAHSLAFAGRWGKIVDIDPADMMPYKVMFRSEGRTFRFCQKELMTEVGYLENLMFCDTVFTVDHKVVKIIKCDTNCISTSGGDYSFPNLLPITRCRSCNCDTTGLLTSFCEDCEYHVPLEE